MNSKLREEFEKFYLAQWKKDCAWASDKTIEDVIKLRGKSGNYSEWPYTHGCWIGYQAGINHE